MLICVGQRNSFWGASKSTKGLRTFAKQPIRRIIDHGLPTTNLANTCRKRQHNSTHIDFGLTRNPITFVVKSMLMRSNRNLIIYLYRCPHKGAKLTSMPHTICGAAITPCNLQSSRIAVATSLGLQLHQTMLTSKLKSTADRTFSQPVELKPTVVANLFIKLLIFYTIIVRSHMQGTLRSILIQFFSYLDTSA